MYNDGYPAASFTWRDDSGASSDVLYSTDTDGLNVPFGFILAERGQPGTIYFGGAAELTPILGSETFNQSSPYYTPASEFIGTAMAGQGVEVMRLVDSDATTANMGLFLEITPADIVQYEKDIHGARVVDEDGNFVPLMTSGQNPTEVKEPGYKVKWKVRPLTSQESYNTLTKQTVVNGSTTTEVYPILGFDILSPGAYGNRQGFSLYSTRSENSILATALDSVLYRFIPMELPTRVSTTAAPIPDFYGSSYSDVSFKDVAVYTKTNTNYAFKYVLGNNYVDADSGNTKLPYNIHVYGANIGAIGEKILVVSPELVTEEDVAIDPYLIDLISGLDQDGNHYDHLEIDTESSSVTNSAVVNYASGGSDGDTSFEKLQELIRDWLEGNDHGEFTNLQQHPMTHFSDPGFSMDTKYLLFNMLDLRDNFKIDVATQDVSLPANTKAQDMSAGQALMFRAQMHPESVINGVGCTRVGIYAHAAELVNGSPYSGLVPFTLNRLIQRRDLDGGSYIRGSSGGLPNSQVTIFRKPNWIADDDSVRRLAWGNCMNVVMHASRTVIFYPSLRTVYPNDTSLLSDDEISDRIIYMFKIARRIWAKYAGVRKTPSKLFPLIETDIDNDCATAFTGDNISVKSTVFQSARDANLGYAVSVNLAVTGNLPMRQMNFNVIVGRATE